MAGESDEALVRGQAAEGSGRAHERARAELDVRRRQQLQIAQLRRRQEGHADHPLHHAQMHRRKKVRFLLAVSQEDDRSEVAQ